MSLLRRNPRQRYRISRSYETETHAGKDGRSPTNASNNPPRDQGPVSPSKAHESPSKALDHDPAVVVRQYQPGVPTVALTTSDIVILACIVANNHEVSQGIGTQAQAAIAKAKDLATRASASNKHNGINLKIVHGA